MTISDIKHKDSRSWSSKQSENLYKTRDWGIGFFKISDAGEVVVCINKNGKNVCISLMDIVRGMKQRDLEMPVMLRIENLLDQRIKQLNEAFSNAIKKTNYNNSYRGVYPIKVNQQCHVVKEIAAFGKHYNYGLEAGSKAELIIALSQLQNHDSLIICNGYKDASFIDLGLYAIKMGFSCFFVLETLSELPIILERSRTLEIEPMIGVRIKLASSVEGHWNQDSGDRSLFGLSTNALLSIVKQLKSANKLHCLQLIHCHLGSQIPNIRNIRRGVSEVCRFYAGLIAEGAPLGYLDLGGGLAVDYEGSQTNTTHSMNYVLDEYCTNIIETIQETFDPLNIQHPVIITESGRALVAYSSMLLFNILDVRSKKPNVLPVSLAEESHEILINLYTVLNDLTVDNLQECYNDSLYYQDEIRELFHRGQASINDRALAENINLSILERITQLIPQAKRISPELEKLPELLSDIYYGNFSVFQSLPDVWAIDQIFPVMPIHRLNEEPVRNAILADITCDCDGKINHFSSPKGQQKTIKLHELREDEEYYIGVFLVGAYQETLGDLHNLFGDTNVVSVNINEDGSFDFVHEFQGDSIADVLSYVEYDPKIIQEQFRCIAEQAVRSKKITVEMRQKILKTFGEILGGYTYIKR